MAAGFTFRAALTPRSFWAVLVWIWPTHNAT